MAVDGILVGVWAVSSMVAGWWRDCVVGLCFVGIGFLWAFGLWGRLVVVIVRVCWWWLGVWMCGASVVGCSGMRVSWRRVGLGGGCGVVWAAGGLAWVWVRVFRSVQKECRVVWWLVSRVGWLVLLGYRLGWAVVSGW